MRAANSSTGNTHQNASLPVWGVITWSTIVTRTATAIGQRRSGTSVALGVIPSVVISHPLHPAADQRARPRPLFRRGHSAIPKPSSTTLDDDTGASCSPRWPSNEKGYLASSARSWTRSRRMSQRPLALAFFRGRGADEALAAP